MINKYEKYNILSTNKIFSLNDLKFFGVLNNQFQLNEEDIYLSYINQIEKNLISKNDWKYKINKYNFR